MALLIAACVALVLPACGDDSGAGGTSTEQRYVTEADLGGHAEGSPQRVTLEWWRAAQFGNATVARGFYARRAAPQRIDLQRQLSAATSQFVGVPKFHSADLRGGRATLYFFLSRPGADVPPRPLSINLVRQAGRWRLADNVLLEQQVARVAKLLRERDE